MTVSQNIIQCFLKIPKGFFGTLCIKEKFRKKIFFYSISTAFLLQNIFLQLTHTHRTQFDGIIIFIKKVFNRTPI